MRIAGTSRYLLAACVTRHAVTRPDDLHGLQDLVISLASGMSTAHVDVLLEDCAEAAGISCGTFGLIDRGPGGQRVDRRQVRERAQRAPQTLKRVTEQLLDLDLPAPHKPGTRGDEHLQEWLPTLQDLERALLAAAAYAIGRRSYIVGTVAEWVHSFAPQMSAQATQEIVDMIDAGPLGDRQDADAWMSVRAQLRGTPVNGV